MVTVSQTPAPVKFIVAGGSPVVATIKLTLTDEDGATVAPSVLSVPDAHVYRGSRAIAALEPRVSSEGDGVFTVSWTAAQTLAMQGQDQRWAFTVFVSGQGPYHILADVLEVRRRGWPRARSGATIDARVVVGGVTVETAVSLVGAHGEIGSDSAPLPPGGSPGAALVKVTSADNHVAWADLATDYLKILTGDRVNGRAPVWNAGAGGWDMVSLAGGTAEGTTIADPDELFPETVTNVEQALALVKAAADDRVRATGGGQERVASYTNAGATGSTAIVFDLANGNVHEVTSTGGNFTATVANPGLSGRATSFTVFLTVTANTVGHIPTFSFPGLVWPNGAPSTAASSWMTAGLRILSFVSLNGGTTWVGFDLTPRPSLQSFQFSYPGSFPAASTTVPIIPGIPNSSTANRTIERIVLNPVTAPGSAVWLDFHTGAKGATTSIFSTATPGTAPGRIAYTTTAIITVTSFNTPTWGAGHVLELYADQVGAPAAGGDLYGEISFREGV